MDTIVIYLELVGAAAFAISGAMVGINKGLDVFGICVLGLSTAVGGGIIRDIILGDVPPVVFTNPIYALVGLITCGFVLIPEVRSLLQKLDVVISLADAVGLGIFTASGTMHAVSHGGSNMFLAVFIGVVVGVGGGLLRDIMANVEPFIFTKHIYATAAIAGGVTTYLLFPYIGKYTAMFLGAGVVVLIRILALKFDWNLPRITKGELQ